MLKFGIRIVTMSSSFHVLQFLVYGILAHGHPFMWCQELQDQLVMLRIKQFICDDKFMNEMVARVAGCVSANFVAALFLFTQTWQLCYLVMINMSAHFGKCNYVWLFIKCSNVWLSDCLIILGIRFFLRIQRGHYYNSNVIRSGFLCFFKCLILWFFVESDKLCDLMWIYDSLLHIMFDLSDYFIPCIPLTPLRIHLTIKCFLGIPSKIEGYSQMNSRGYSRVFEGIPLVFIFSEYFCFFFYTPRFPFHKHLDDEGGE